MGQGKTKTPRAKALKKLGERLGTSTQKAQSQKTVSDQFAVLSKELLDIGRWLPTVDSSAQPGWMNEIGTGLGHAALGLGVLENCGINEQPETIEAVGLLADGLNVVAESLVDGGESLSGIRVPKKNKNNDIDLSNLKQMTTDLVFDTGMVAQRLAATVGEGLDDEGIAIHLPVFSSTCGCAARHSRKEMVSEADENGPQPIVERTPFTFERQILVATIEEVGVLLERLLILLLEFASLMLIMATGYIPWHCTQECIGDGALLGATLKGTHAKRLGNGWYQPQIYITWEYCCYNLCVLAWNNQFTETVDSGPHNIGQAVGHPNAVTAQNRANAAAKTRATLRAMLRIGAPGAPC